MNGQHNWLSTDWSEYMVFLIVVAEDSIFLRSRELGIFSFSLVVTRKLLLISIMYIFQLHSQ